MFSFLRRLFCRHENTETLKEHCPGVTLGWGLNPQRRLDTFRRCKDCSKKFWDRGNVLPYTIEITWHSEYYPDGYGSWPRDPVTGEKLPVAE
jgi:hypothetical protein